MSVSIDELAHKVARILKDGQGEQRKELNGQDLQTLISHAILCKDGVCEIRDTYDREVDRIIREDLDVCEGCGEVVNKRRKPKTCPSCGGELDW